ncbi:non-ribosomal peptide synthetase [Kitasatospora viridis]|uniref:Amino acid adenylation domain-containing protein n=1 Tax=Kitasatospora viridis TaxID=281105 RepID=A0A561UQ66_9ACTN|nr:non-ribosomal peptide synthetase [Kitasatospora viridis]TWG01469.1 amino acid adenylation domain-containing protein [Kitasatospora viridis]
MEWVFLAIGAGHCVAHVVEGDGSLTVDQLTRAVAAAAQASPGMRLVRRGRQWVDSGTAPAVEVLDTTGGLLGAPALQRPLDPRRQACEVLLAPGPRSTVVFRAFHGITDGRGLLLWAADVFRVLRGEEPLGADSRLNDDELVRGLDRPGGLPPAQPNPGLEWPPLLGRRSPGSSGVLWRRRTVDGRHPAATAKVAAALARTHGEGRGRFFVPVDLRRHRPELRSTASLARAVQLAVEPGDGWQQAQRRLLSLLAADAELAPQFPDSILRTPLPVLRLVNAGIDLLAARKDRYNSLAYLSHQGAVDLADFEAGEFRATAVYPLGTTGPGSPLEVNLLERPGRTEVTVAWHDGPGKAERADAVLDTIEEALSPREHRQWAGNRTARPLPDTRSVVELFREQVERTPERIALSGPEGDVSYAQLSRRADAVAAALRERGVGPGDVVGLLAGRTVASIAAVWGVLRAGACYLPLDTRHPDARITDLLTDADCTYCLVEQPYDTRECVRSGCKPLLLDELADAAAPEDWQDVVPAPEDLAYVIYTSGSTGRPKGVQIEHRNLANYVHWGTRAFDVDADTRLPLLTSPSFDVTGTSVYLPLLAGGRVILMPDDPTHLSLRRLLADSGANALNLTPSHLDLIGQLDLSPTGYRTVIVIGEQLRVEVAARAQRMFGPDCRIINEYGPTEATIGCTAHTFDPARDGELAVVPIGLPADNTTVHLLDADGRFVAPGETGEMYLGGAQLARGYLGRPDLDRERFVHLADGTRVYRTGDLARLLPSGEIECVGRIDDQVKVRGHRVEPAEVAQALEEHPAVDRAVVVARPRAGQPGKALYGYALTNSAVRPEELTAHLAAVLPPYMVPAAITTLTELPYTVSGKIDTKALPDPHAAATDAPAPMDPTEQAVADIWARTLGTDGSRLDPQSDFHHLGGDSVSLLGMLAAVCRELLTSSQEAVFMDKLPTILVAPTVAHVAALARAARS